MELGEKLRQARLEAGLSQRQLCGDRLTRNMLSLIENGSARPSMDTLRYLATRLGKTVSYFLEEQAVTSPNQAVMAAARACWDNGDAAGVLQALEDFRTPDETYSREQALLSYLSRLNLAEQAIREERLPYARALLEKAARESGPYVTEPLQLQYHLLMAQTGEAESLNIDIHLQVQAQLALERKDPRRCLALLEAAEDHHTPHWQLLAGLAHFALGSYALAAEQLTAAEEAYPAQTVPKLEICHRELGDYKKAYEYACKGRT